MLVYGFKKYLIDKKDCICEGLGDGPGKRIALGLWKLWVTESFSESKQHSVRIRFVH